jgi:hypothetical protein
MLLSDWGQNDYRRGTKARFFGTKGYCMSKADHIAFALHLFTRPFYEAFQMTIRRSVALLVSAAALIAAAACSSPTAPKGCDVVTNAGNTTC